MSRPGLENSEEFTGFPAGPDGSQTKRAEPPVQVEFGAGSDIGKVRDENQDHYSIVRIGRTLDVVRSNLPEGDLPEHVQDIAYGMVVADGMGGMVGGQRASLLAIQTGIRLVLESPRWALRIDEQESVQLIERMRAYFHEVDATLIRVTEVEPSLFGMGTTLTVAYSVGNRAFFVHAGDSRAYLMRGGELRQLTRDHTLAQSLVDSGRIPAESVESHASRHILVNYAGGPRRGIEPEIGTVELENGDRLMLCTDGLTGMLSDNEIAQVLQQHDQPEPAAQALIQHALLRGGRDNVTVVLAQYRICE
jgi:PPM family protein phosphatase